MSFKHSGVAETGLSDHHSLIYSMLKTTFVKSNPKKLIYRKLKNFKEERFLQEISEKLTGLTSYSDFQRVFSEVLEKHAPKKTRFLRANNKPHMNKVLRKAIMKRSRLKNVAHCTMDPSDWARYKVQRNLVVNMNRDGKNAEIFIHL